MESSESVLLEKGEVEFKGMDVTFDSVCDHNCCCELGTLEAVRIEAEKQMLADYESLPSLLHKIEECISNSNTGSRNNQRY